MDLRQPFSSLLSKQSGNPSHCHPPGTHFPSAHMKFPGMLHSVVMLFPGSSWLSDREEGSMWLPTLFLDRYHGRCVTRLNALKTGKCLVNADTYVCAQRDLKWPPSAETLNLESPNQVCGISGFDTAAASWDGMWNTTFWLGFDPFLEAVRFMTKTRLGSQEECGVFRPFFQLELRAKVWTVRQNVTAKTNVSCSRRFWTAAYAKTKQDQNRLQIPTLHKLLLFIWI